MWKIRRRRQRNGVGFCLVWFSATPFIHVTLAAGEAGGAVVQASNEEETRVGAPFLTTTSHEHEKESECVLNRPPLQIADTLPILYT